MANGQPRAMNSESDFAAGLLGGSWAVINGVTTRVTMLITHIRGLITLLITTHEPPSTVMHSNVGASIIRTGFLGVPYYN